MGDTPTPLRVGLAGTAATLLAGCVPAVSLEVAPSVLATEWDGGRRALSTVLPAPAAAPASTDLGAALGTAELDRLLRAAEQRNADVAVATARIRQARALLGIARGAMLPTISASAGLSGARTGTSGGPFDFSSAFTGGLDLSLDLDHLGSLLSATGDRREFIGRR